MSDTEKRARAIDNQKWQAWIDAGYRFYEGQHLKHADGLLQKCIRDGKRLFFINTYVYVWDGRRGEPDKRIGLQVETQFSSGEKTFNVTLCGMESPQEAEQFMRDVYERMNCTPYDDEY